MPAGSLEVLVSAGIILEGMIGARARGHGDRVRAGYAMQLRPSLAVTKTCVLGLLRI